MDVPAKPNCEFGARTDGKITLSFFRAPASKVLQTLIYWGSEVSRTITPYFPLATPWNEFLGEYLTPNTTIILAPTRSEWCAYVDNDRIAGMPFSELLVIAERLATQSASFMISDWEYCRKRDMPYTIAFNYCDGSRGEGIQRYVCVERDCGRWQFSETGSPLAFEEIDAYKNRKKADRLTPDMLIRYARALAIHLDEGNSFYMLDRAIGLKWEWARSAALDDGVALVKQIGDRINKELGVNWPLDVFGK